MNPTSTTPGNNQRILTRQSAFWNMKYRVTIEQDEDGAFIAKCPSLPGCVSEGKTRKEALDNIKDAIDGYLASLKKHHEPIPPSIDEELVEVSA